MAKIGSLDVSRFCLGANVFGWTADREASFAVLDGFVAAGGTVIDTADSYMWRVPGNSGGESETIIGDWMAERGNRDEVVVATKVGSRPDVRGRACRPRTSGRPARTRCAGCAPTGSTCTGRTRTTRTPRRRRPWRRSTRFLPTAGVLAPTRSGVSSQHTAYARVISARIR